MRPAIPRWLLALLLVVISLLQISNFFVRPNSKAYHAPGAIGASLQAYFRLDSEQVALLFTVYAAPNIVLVFVGGLLMDKYGLVRTSLAFNVSMLLGMILFASAPRGSGASSSMPYLLTGRFLLGLGGECLVAGASAMLARWFKKTPWLTFAMGFNTAAVQLLGSAPAFVLLPWLLGDEARNARSTEPATSDDASSAGVPLLPEGGGNVRLCLWVVVIVGVLSVLANVAYALVELRYAKIYVPLFMDDQEEFENQMNMEVVRLEMKQRDRERDVAAHIAATTPNKKKLLGGGSKKPSNKKNPKASQGGAYHIVQTSGIEEIEVAPAGAEAEEEEEEEMQEEEQKAAPQNSEESKESSTSASTANGHAVASSAVASSATDGLSTHPSSPLAGISGSGAEHTGLLGGLSTLWSAGVHDGSSSASSALSSLSLWRPWQILRQLSVLWWLVFLSHVLLSPILYSFSAFGPSFFVEKYGYTSEEAGVLTSILYLSIIFAPAFGWAIDRIGYRCIIQSIAAAIVPIVFLLVHFTHLSPYLLMVLLGLAFAVTESNGLAMIADVTPAGLLGSAYGAVGCGASLALVVEPWLVGWIHYHTGRYSASTLLFVGVASAGWLASFAVYVYDCNHDNLMTLAAPKGEEMEGAGLGGGDMSVGGGVAQGNGNGVGSNAGHELFAHRLYPELEIVFDEEAMGAEHSGGEEEFRLDEFDEELP